MISLMKPYSSPGEKNPAAHIFFKFELIYTTKFWIFFSTIKNSNEFVEELSNENKIHATFKRSF